MCGLAGFFGGEIGGIKAQALLARMCEAIVHRGPDNAGYWTDSSEQISLGHRRLSIVDLTPAGHQPMVSPSGRYVIAFNGEIYNHSDLRVELEALSVGDKRIRWRGHSDTETLLTSIEVWGVKSVLNKLNGMFAFALWDRVNKTLLLARDRIGEKPLYYGWTGTGRGRVFLFGSELKAIKAHPEFLADINRNSICLLLRFNYIPAPYSIYHGVSKLEPGCYLSVSLVDPEPKISKYWSTTEVALSGYAHPFLGSPVQAVDALELLLKDAVSRQMMADVPLGAFLSGGVDSSTVVALMQAQSSRPIKTFTIGFTDDGYSEADHAKAVAKYLGTEHTELYVTSEQAMDVIPRLPVLYCEPFADSSQIPTFLVSQLAKQYVAVSLSGDAGDELFCGYNRYQLTASLWSKLSVVPKPLRKLIANGITSISPTAWNRYAGFLALTSVGDKLHKGAGVMTSNSAEDLYFGMVSIWNDPGALVVGGVEPATNLTCNKTSFNCLSDVQRMMALDTLSYLPDDILVKVDRASMGNSLESRVPFLDYRVVEFAWKLPMDYKLRQGKTKWALRQVLYRYVPGDLIERPKMGFGFPIDKWLRGPLKDWAEELISEARLRDEGYFHPKPIREKWNEHLSGKRNWSSQLWGVLMFQAWLEVNKSS